MKRYSSYIKFDRPIKEDLDYMRIRPKKVDAPDVGTYDVSKSVNFVKAKNPKWTLNKGK
jgi:hypothetical protein